MQYRQHVIKKIENLEGKLKHIEFHNGRGNKTEVNNAKKECEDLIEDIKATIEREPHSPNEINKY